MFVIAALLIRLAFIVFYRIDSDEPQHLHVAWGWSHGLVQYRDLSDNHFPLLHLLFAPLMRVMPETSSIFLWMRFAIAPFAIASSWLLYTIAKPLLGTRRAAAAAILFSVMPPWLAKSVEFRNDTLWIFFWLAAIALVMSRRPMWAGVAAALCLLASVKALPLLLAHGLAFSSQRRSVSLKRFACGAAIPLAAAAIFLQTQGALRGMLYATLLLNAAVPVLARRRVLQCGAAVLGGVFRHFVAAEDGAMTHLKLVAVWYPIVLAAIWPIVTPRDFLPLVPLASLAIASLDIAPSLAFAAATIASVLFARLWRPADATPAHFVDSAVAITQPDDYVFDLKGETVFRRRPVYPTYEIVGRALTRTGRFADRGPESIAANRCCVAIADAPFIPARTRAFLNEHFIRYGPLRVCGATPRGGAFTIAVPQTYAVVARDPAHIRIDGIPYRGPRFLAAGRHTLIPPNDRVTIIWSGVSAKEDADCKDSHTLAGPSRRSPLCGAVASMAPHTR